MRLILPLTLIVIAAVGFFSLISPMLEEVKVLRADVDSFNEALNNARDLKAERDKLTAQFNSFTSENLERLEVLLPNTINNIRLILEIECLASPYGMVLRDVKYDTVREEDPEGKVLQAGAPGALTVPKNYGTWALEFATEGSYDNFLAFLASVESNLRLIDIASITFTSPAGNPGASPSSLEKYKYGFKVNTYWLKNVFPEQ